MAKKKELQEHQVEMIELDVDRKLDSERETTYRAHLIQATAMVTCQAMASGKTAKEAVDMFAEAYQLMQDWYKAKPLKEQIEQIIETVLPERYY